MERIIFSDVGELADQMMGCYYDLEDCVAAVCHYEIATALLSELIKSDLSIGQLDISDYEYNRYDKEYRVMIMDNCIYLNPIYSQEHGKYLGTYSNVMYVHQDCNSKLLKYIDCHQICEFALADLDEIDEFARDGMNVNIKNDIDDDSTTHYSNYVTINRNKFGTPTGFTKSWSNNDSGIWSYSSCSFYCDDGDVVRLMAKEFDIDL